MASLVVPSLFHDCHILRRKNCVQLCLCRSVFSQPSFASCWLATQHHCCVRFVTFSQMHSIALDSAIICHLATRSFGGMVQSFLLSCSRLRLERGKPLCAFTIGYRTSVEKWRRNSSLPKPLALAILLPRIVAS